MIVVMISLAMHAVHMALVGSYIHKKIDSGIVIASKLELCRLYRILHQSRVAHIYMQSM